MNGYTPPTQFERMTWDERQAVLARTMAEILDAWVESMDEIMASWVESMDDDDLEERDRMYQELRHG